MARILRGDVVWANLNPVLGHERGRTRPLVVLSESVFNAKSGTVIAMAMTSREPRVGFPLAMELLSVKLAKRSWVKISQIRTLSVERVGKRIGRVSTTELDRLIQGLNEILGIA